MPNQRIVDSLNARRNRGAGALLPYITAGFPDAATTIELIRCADEVGCSVVEIGFPYSDSIADGPVIQASFHSALAAGHRLDDTFALVEQSRAQVGCALIAMVSHSLIYPYGVNAFIDRCRAAGFDGMIVPDAPLEECAQIANATRAAGLGYIGLVSPTTSRKRRVAIAKQSTGFLYQMAVSGTTGERQSLAKGLGNLIGELRAVSDLPVCVGFGVSNPDHVREVCLIADGAIVGSAVVGRIEAGLRDGLAGAALVAPLRQFLAEMVAATVQTANNASPEG